MRRYTSDEFEPRLATTKRWMKMIMLSRSTAVQGPRDFWYRRPRAAVKSPRKRAEGPWVWLAYRGGRCLFSTHIVAPCFLTFVRRDRVHSQTFEGGIDTPRFLVSEEVVGNRCDRVMSARGSGARYKLV